MSDDRIIGEPEVDAEFFPGVQSYMDTCAVRCQEFILERFTGVDIPEDALVQEAQAAGWYAPGQGTIPEDVGNLLEAHGISTHRVTGATVYDLADELAQGHKVMIGVDSTELWEGKTILQEIAEWLGIEEDVPGADHAVVVSGIDTTDPDNPQVIVSDPGTGEHTVYPMEHFLDAWEVELPAWLWDGLAAFVRTEQTLDELADQPARDALVTALDDAQDDWADALDAADLDLRRRWAVAADAAQREAVAEAAEATASDRTSQYTRGDGPSGRTPEEL